MTTVLPGVCSVTFRARPALEVVRLAAAAGLAGIEWGSDVHVPAGDTVTAERLAAACRDAALTCPSYGSYLRAGEAIGGSELAAVLDTAAALGATNVRVWTTWADARTTADDDRRRIAADLASWAAAAASRELTLSLEFHGHTLTETAASTMHLLDEAGRPANLFTYWQPMDGLAIDACLAELETVTSRLSHLHVFRWIDWRTRLPLAAGADLWPDAFAGVATAVSDWTTPRYAFLEFVVDDDAEQFARDAATLVTWLRGIGAGSPTPVSP